MPRSRQIIWAAMPTASVNVGNANGMTATCSTVRLAVIAVAMTWMISAQYSPKTWPPRMVWSWRASLNRTAADSESVWWRTSGSLSAWRHGCSLIRKLYAQKAFPKAWMTPQWFTKWLTPPVSPLNHLEGDGEPAKCWNASRALTDRWGITMPDSDQRTCGKWMPRKKTYCARGSGHQPPCATPEAMQSQRQRNVGRERYYNPEVKRKWRVTYKLKGYGLTQGDFDLLLEIQGYACGMCRDPFGKDDPVFIDHDHSHCPEEKRACRECVRGLLCLDCNTTLGHIERKYELARAYLDNPPVRQAGRALTEVTDLTVREYRVPVSLVVKGAQRPTDLAPGAEHDDRNREPDV